jgi:hypothetical protein
LHPWFWFIYLALWALHPWFLVANHKKFSLQLHVCNVAKLSVYPF